MRREVFASLLPIAAIQHNRVQGDRGRALCEGFRIAQDATYRYDSSAELPPSEFRLKLAGLDLTELVIGAGPGTLGPIDAAKLGAQWVGWTIDLTLPRSATGELDMLRSHLREPSLLVLEHVSSGWRWETNVGIASIDPRPFNTLDGLLERPAAFDEHLTVRLWINPWSDPVPF